MIFPQPSAITQSGFGYGVVRDLVGHGIGTNLHEDPQIPNFRQKTTAAFELVAGYDTGD